MADEGGDEEIAGFQSGPLQRRKAKPQSWTKARRAAFLAELAHSCNVTRAHVAAGMGDRSGYVLRQADMTLPVVPVRASAGKVRRAEPVALAYERGQVVHAGVFADLEDQLCGLQIGGGYAGPGRSPDRADACVWALAALRAGMRKGRGPGVRVV